MLLTEGMNRTGVESANNSINASVPPSVVSFSSDTEAATKSDGMCVLLSPPPPPPLVLFAFHSLTVFLQMTLDQTWTLKMMNVL